MSSTTEEEDWNVVYKARTYTSLTPVSEGPMVSEEPSFSVQGAAPQTEHVPGQSLPSNVTSTVLNDAVGDEYKEAASAISEPISTTPGPAIIQQLDGDFAEQRSQEWQNARELVISQMATSQAIILSHSDQHLRGGVIKPGGRRGRGGRKPQIKIEPPPDEQGQDGNGVRKINRGGRPRGSRAGASSGRGINRGGRPRGSRAGMSASTGRGLKRKRRNGDDDDDDEEDDNSSSSEEITALPTQSRSGRRITQANTFSPLIPTGSPNQSLANKHLSPSLKVTDNPFASPSTPQGKNAGTKLKRKRITASAVCHNCLRGQSPLTNQIVFCDTCNTPYHQYCHDPPISPTILQLTESEWHCADCAIAAAENTFLNGRVPAPESWGLAEKRRYLQAMDKDELISLLLSASSMLPNLPMLRSEKAANSKDDNATIIAAPEITNDDTVTTAPAATEPTTPIPLRKTLEFEYPESEQLPYPSAGNGLTLPPEEDDIDILVDEDTVTYSHSWVNDAFTGKWTGAMREEELAMNGGIGGLGGVSRGVAISVGA